MIDLVTRRMRSGKTVVHGVALTPKRFAWPYGALNPRTLLRHGHGFTHPAPGHRSAPDGAPSHVPYRTAWRRRARLLPCTGLDARRRGRHGPPDLAPLAIQVTHDIYPS